MTGKMVTLQHSSTISRVVLELMKDPHFDLSSVGEEDIKSCEKEIDNFLHDVWIQVGDKEFNRSGLRNATDILIDYLGKK